MRASQLLRPYTWTFVTVGTAALLVAFGPDLFRAEGLAFVFLAAVVASAYRGGTGPGIASIFLSLFIAFGLFRTPAWDFSNPDYMVSELAFIVLGLLLTSLIAYRRRAGQALRKSEAQYGDLVQNANSAILRWRRDGTLTFFNEYAESFFGYRAEEILGKHVGLLVPERESSGGDLTGLVQDIVEHPERYTQNVNENVCKDGRRAWMVWTNRPVFDERGELLEILAVGSDISARKHAEEAFRDSLLLLETIVTHMPAAACIIRGTDLRLQSVNPAYQAFAPGKAMLGRTLDEIWPETGQAFSVLCRQVLNTGEPLHYFDEPYTIRRSPDGPTETAFFSWSLHRVPLPGAEGWGLLNTAWETTERKRFEEELRAVNETLEERVRERTADLERSRDALKQSERLATIGEVMTGLSHESRNALQRALVGIEILERRLKDQPPLRQLLLEVRKAHQDLRRVYESVQDFARPIILDRKKSDLALAWRSAWESLTAREGRQATLREELDEADRECEVDISQLEQVFRNLYDNALAACPDPVEVCVRFQAMNTQAGPHVRVSVRDNGPGVPSEQRKRIFEPFYTTKTKGTGLGLAIVQRIVEAHGGGIALNAETGSGLEIAIDLPRKVVPNGPADENCAGRRRGIPADVHGGPPG